MTTVTITFKEKTKIIEALLNAFKSITGVKVKVEPEKEIIDCKKSHIPNAKTIKAIKNMEEGKNVIACKNRKDFWAKINA